MTVSVSDVFYIKHPEYLVSADERSVCCDVTAALQLQLLSYLSLFTGPALLLRGFSCSPTEPLVLTLFSQKDVSPQIKLKQSPFFLVSGVLLCCVSLLSWLWSRTDRRTTRTIDRHHDFKLQQDATVKRRFVFIILFRSQDFNSHQSSVTDTNSLRLSTLTGGCGPSEPEPLDIRHWHWYWHWHWHWALPFTYITLMQVQTVRSSRYLHLQTNIWAGLDHRTGSDSLTNSRFILDLKRKHLQHVLSLQLRMKQHFLSCCSLSVSVCLKVWTEPEESDVDQDAASTFSYALTVFYYSFQRKRDYSLFQGFPAEFVC